MRTVHDKRVGGALSRDGCCRRDAVPRDDLLQLLPQLNPLMTTDHFNCLLDQMFAGLKVGGDTGVMTCIQARSEALDVFCA